MQRCAELLMKSRKPVLYVGQGAVISGAGQAIMRIAEKLNAPIVNTLLGKGACAEDHPLHLGMLGMHGTAYANKAIEGCDMIMAIGARWDDRITGKLDEFCKGATKIHVDIDVAEFNKIVQPDVSLALAMPSSLSKTSSPSLANSTAMSGWPRPMSGASNIHYATPSRAAFARKPCSIVWINWAVDAIITTDVGQHQMWAAQFLRTVHNRFWICSGGAGTMGFRHAICHWCTVRHAENTGLVRGWRRRFQMTLFELATAQIHKLPIKILIINNNYLGMVRQWQELFFDNRLSGVDLEGNPDFIKLAAAYDIPGWRIKRAADIDKVLTKAIDYNDGPCVVEAEVIKGDNVFPMIPAGAGYDGCWLKHQSIN